MNYAIAIIAGNLCHDPELRATANGTNVVEFSVAVNRDKKNGEREVDFFDCKAFGKVAEIIATHFHKGKPIFIEGKPYTERWTNKDGQKRSKVAFFVNNFQFIGGRENDTAAEDKTKFKPMTPPAYRRPQPSAKEPAEQQGEIDFGDVPF